MVERGVVPPLTKASHALIYYVRFINLQKGDVIRLRLKGPGGFNVKNKMTPLERSKAQYVAYVGKKRRARSWSSGLYTSEVELVRGDEVVITASAKFNML